MNDPIYAVQDAAIRQLQILPFQGSSAVLCGGTALSRLYLRHRVSFDLDFFYQKLDARALGAAIKASGLRFQATSLVDSEAEANQLHGTLQLPEGVLKISFVEDAYAGVYPQIEQEISPGLAVLTEPVEGLYHRKLRTIVGAADAGERPVGGRQTARDLFDLYVLSRVVMPIRLFAKSLPYQFPLSAFENGIGEMPWFTLIPELKELRAAPQWETGKAVETLRNALYAELGLSSDVDSEA